MKTRLGLIKYPIIEAQQLINQVIIECVCVCLFSLSILSHVEMSSFVSTLPPSVYECVLHIFIVNVLFNLSGFYLIPE